jgi:hypothetical protein
MPSFGLMGQSMGASGLPAWRTGVGGRELPVSLGVALVAVALPSGNFFNRGLFVGDAPVEALAWQHAEFWFSNIQPTAICALRRGRLLLAVLDR